MKSPATTDKKLFGSGRFRLTGRNTVPDATVLYAAIELPMQELVRAVIEESHRYVGRGVEQPGAHHSGPKSID